MALHGADESARAELVLPVVPSEKSHELIATLPRRSARPRATAAHAPCADQDAWPAISAEQAFTGSIH